MSKFKSSWPQLISFDKKFTYLPLIIMCFRYNFFIFVIVSVFTLPYGASSAVYCYRWYNITNYSWTVFCFFLRCRRLPHYRSCRCCYNSQAFRVNATAIFKRHYILYCYRLFHILRLLWQNYHRLWSSWYVILWWIFSQAFLKIVLADKTSFLLSRYKL